MVSHIITLLFQIHPADLNEYQLPSWVKRELKSVHRALRAFESTAILLSLVSLRPEPQLWAPVLLLATQIADSTWKLAEAFERQVKGKYEKREGC